MNRSLTLPYIPPGSNALFQMHHHEVARWRAALRRDVAQLTRVELVEGRCRLVIDLRWRTRQKRDPGNYVEGLKGAIDGLVGRWIVDDDADHIELLVRGTIGTGEPDCVVITLEAA